MPREARTEPDDARPPTQGWSRLQAAFETAAALAPPERAAFLERCRDVDRRLADEVEALVRAGAEAGTFIEEAIARELRR